MTSMARESNLSRKQSGLRSDSWLHAFLRWWARELAWFVPIALKERGLASSQLRWLQVTPQAAVFNRIARGKTHEVGSIDLSANDPVMEKIAFDKLLARIGTQPVGIGVQSGQLLHKRLLLPLAARDNLEQVIRFEMDRQTPYRAEQVYFHFAEAGIEAGKVLVDLTVLPKHSVDSALVCIKDWGLDLHGIAAITELDGRRGYVNLLPKSMRPVTGRHWPWLYGVMGTLTVTMIAAILVVPVWHKREASIALQPQVLKWEREAKAVAVLKTDLAAALGRHNHLIQKKLTTLPTVAILEEASRLLPDNTWLQALEVRGPEVVLSGETGASSRLVGLFTESKVFGDANHKSPLVKSNNNLERFQLSVALRSISMDDALAGVRAVKAQLPGKKDVPSGVPATHKGRQ